MQGSPGFGGGSATSGVLTPNRPESEGTGPLVSVVKERCSFDGRGRATVVLYTPDPVAVSAARTLGHQDAINLALQYARQQGMPGPAVDYRTRGIYGVDKDGKSVFELLQSGGYKASQAVNTIVGHCRDIKLRVGASGI